MTKTRSKTMTEEEIKQEEHYKEMGNAYLDKCIKAEGFVILAKQLRNDFVDMYVAGCFESTKELKAQLAISEHDREHNDYELTEAYKKIADLEAQIEKMKCCENCKHSDTECEGYIVCSIGHYDDCRSNRQFENSNNTDYWELEE